MLNHLKTWLRNRPIWQITLLVLVPIPCLIAFGIWFSSQRSLNAKLDAIREQGLPTNVDELNDYYSVPEGVIDSTDLWLAAIEALELADFDNRELEIPFAGGAGTPAIDENWQGFPKAKQLITDLNDELYLVYRAAEAGGQIRYAKILSAFDIDTVATLQSSRSVARFLTIAVQVHILSDQCNSALADAISILSLSNSLEGEVTLISALMRLAYQAMAITNLELILFECDLNDEQSLKIQKIVLESNIRKSMIKALNGELALTASGIDQLPITTFKTSNKHAALKYFTESKATFSRSWFEILQFQKEFKRQVNKESSGRMDSSKQFDEILAQGAGEDFVIANMRAVVRQRCANAALAVRRFQLKNGTVPKSLQVIPQELLSTGEFSKELLIDPFDDEPLRFKLEEDRLLIYSIGENQIDDGGDCPRGDGGIDLDLGFWLKLSN